MPPEQEDIAVEKLPHSQVYLDASTSVRMQALGQVVLFLLPSIKLEKTLPTGQTCADAVHEYLKDNFDGYTATSSHRTGFWRQGAEETYKDHREYKVSCQTDGKLPQLVMFLGRIACIIEEQSIYVETAETSWLVHPVKPR